jgi:hypothetical protein
LDALGLRDEQPREDDRQNRAATEEQKYAVRNAKKKMSVNYSLSFGGVPFSVCFS